MSNQPSATEQQRMHAIHTCLEARGDQPVKAIQLAEVLHLGGSRECQKREVRRLVALMHDAGFRVCGDNHPKEGGYWLARSDAEWGRYTNSRRIDARFAFVTTRRMAVAAQERGDGQAKLFEQPVEGTRAHHTAWAGA